MKELAEKVGVSAWQTVQQWEKADGTAPKRARLEAVANALKTTPAYLTYGPGAQTDFANSLKSLLEEVEQVVKNDLAPMRNSLSTEAVRVGAAFDRVAKREHKELVISALKAFGGWVESEDEDTDKKST